MNGKEEYVGGNGFAITRWTLETTEHRMYGGGACKLQMTFSFNEKTASTKFEESSFIRALKNSFLNAIGELIPSLNGFVSRVRFDIELKVKNSRFVAVVVSDERRFKGFTDGNPNKAIVLSVFNFYDSLIQKALKAKVK